MSAAITAPQREPLVSKGRALGLVLMAIWICLGVALVAALVSSIYGDRLAHYGPLILSGSLVTIRLVATSLAVGALISIPVAAGRLSENRLLGALAYAYSYFFRGTPLIAQAFLVYYGAGQFAPQLRAAGLWWFFRDAYNCAVFSFALNTAAYQAEILAGAIRAIPRGQREAARVLGLHRFVTMWRVILPQALITALRPYGNEIILMIQVSAIASIITVLDLMGQTRYIFSQTYDLSFYLWAGVFYLIMVETVGRVINRIERRLTRHLAMSRR